MSASGLASVEEELESESESAGLSTTNKAAGLATPYQDW